jgi:hypothetical protein
LAARILTVIGAPLGREFFIFLAFVRNNFMVTFPRRTVHNKS